MTYRSKGSIESKIETERVGESVCSGKGLRGSSKLLYKFLSCIESQIGLIPLLPIEVEIQ